MQNKKFIHKIHSKLRNANFAKSGGSSPFMANKLIFGKVNITSCQQAPQEQHRGHQIGQTVEIRQEAPGGLDALRIALENCA